MTWQNFRAEFCRASQPLEKDPNANAIMARIADDYERRPTANVGFRDIKRRHLLLMVPSERYPQALHSLCMAMDLKATEWNLLKDRFDAQVHNEDVCSDSIETLFDDHICRRFGANIAGAVECKTKSDA